MEFGDCEDGMFQLSISFETFALKDFPHLCYRYEGSSTLTSSVKLYCTDGLSQ